MRRRLMAVLVLVLCVSPVFMAGCAKKKVFAVANLPPETRLFVQGPVDAVNHLVHLYWFGSDPDGGVLGYELRFKNPAAPADTGWIFTTHTDSIFAVYTPTGFSAPFFEVRAIDDSPTPRPWDAAPNSPNGARDPSPAFEDFKFTNKPPTVNFPDSLLVTSNAIKDTTYASVTLFWTANDPDGDPSRMSFDLGLDTIPSPQHPDGIRFIKHVTGFSATLDTTDFKEAGVFPDTKPRMAFVRAIDDGGMMSAWDSLRWVVRAAAPPGQHARLLLVDDVSLGVPAHNTIDNLYYNVTASKLAPGTYSVARLELFRSPRPFLSAENMAQTFALFDAVIWYRGNQLTRFSPLMQKYQDGIATYLDHGGHLMIESPLLIAGTAADIQSNPPPNGSARSPADGALREDALPPHWVTRYFGSTALILAPLTGTTDSTVAWSLNGGSNVVSSRYGLDVVVGGDLGGQRGFAVRDTNNVAMWARENELSPAVPRDIPVAISVPVPDSPPGPGRLILFTFPIFVLAGNDPGDPAAVLGKVFNDLGLGP